MDPHSDPWTLLLERSRYIIIAESEGTVSLDYAIVFKGSVILELEDGKRVTLNEGDTVVQRGTMHTWRNETTEWARIYGVVLDAKPIMVDGKVLEQESHKAE
ncbi:hypothetical protein B0H11DRAFT_760825 [Mycena galericulata]|nr:hypothetical protein B0H11DRAFT_760825 [Mycena galericulata]